MRCQINGCGGKAISHGLCDKHRKRMASHGHLECTRPADWGMREKHPLYGTWGWIRSRNKKAGVVPRWDDFWLFIKDVGERPSPAHTIRRYRTGEPYGPDNFFWKERLASSADAKKYQREYRKKNPLASKSSDLKKVFGVTIEDYFAMLESQGGGCAICGTKENGRYKYLAVDHCHESQKIRGLLCNICNRAIGLFKDDVTRLHKAIEYLSKH